MSRARIPSCNWRGIEYVWLAKYQPRSVEAAKELCVPGKKTSLSVREHSLAAPLQIGADEVAGPGPAHPAQAPETSAKSNALWSRGRSVLSSQTTHRRPWRSPGISSRTLS
jgi:hypothetical protein